VIRHGDRPPVPKRRNCLEMKAITISSIARALSLLLVLSALNGVARAAPDSLPFQGTVKAAENNTVEFPLIQINLAAAGQATHLGRFTMTMEGVVNLLNMSAVATAQFHAANGDHLTTQVVGQATPAENPVQITIFEIHTIVGGTGRFAGASGSFTLQRLLDQSTGLSSGAFSGVISLAVGEKPSSAARASALCN
jgi:hypothetical protein